MIKVENLKKSFGPHSIVKDISFHIKKGEIAGFLGANGAGKTTTIRMLNSYLTPSSGEIHINGHCTYNDSLNARKQIGYLPENTPLPQDLRVIEYLNFRAGLKGIKRKNQKTQIETVLEKCWLSDVNRKIIGTLSKGYQQRVALADALLNNPPILILDEPTVGLDPNQIRQIRSVIKDVGSERTVLLSTHILQEVESICNKIIILHKGEIVTVDTPTAIKQKLGSSSTIKVIAKCNGLKFKEELEQKENIKSVYWHSEDILENFIIEVEEGKDLREEISTFLTGKGGIIFEMTQEKASLEDIFSLVTNKESNRGNSQKLKRHIN